MAEQSQVRVFGVRRGFAAWLVTIAPVRPWRLRSGGWQSDAEQFYYLVLLINLDRPMGQCVAGATVKYVTPMPFFSERWPI